MVSCYIEDPKCMSHSSPCTWKLQHCSSTSNTTLSLSVSHTLNLSTRPTRCRALCLVSCTLDPGDPNPTSTHTHKHTRSIVCASNITPFAYAYNVVCGVRPGWFEGGGPWSTNAFAYNAALPRNDNGDGGALTALPCEHLRKYHHKTYGIVVVADGVVFSPPTARPPRNVFVS